MELDAFPRINRVVVTGFLQQDPELRHTPSGVAVASFRIRIGKVNRDRRGLPRETVSFVTVVVWQELAQRICREVKNGQAVSVEGALHTRSFVAASGERKTAVEIYADAMEVYPLFLGGREPRSAAATTGAGDHHADSDGVDTGTDDEEGHNEAPGSPPEDNQLSS